MAEESHTGVQTKWNFDEERMKALSTYMVATEIVFSDFKTNRGIEQIEELAGWLNTIKRAIFGTGGQKDEDNLKEKFKELEKIKRECYAIASSKESESQRDTQFILKAIEFYNKAEEIYETINKVNTKNGLYFRKTEDPRRAIEY